MKVGVVELSTDRPGLTSLADAEIAWRSSAADGDGELAAAAVDAVVLHLSLDDCEELPEAIRRIHERHPGAQVLLAATTRTEVAVASVVSVTPHLPSGQMSRLSLSNRERQVLSGIKAGLTNREIALELGTSLSTINRHVENILLKLPARNRTHAAAVQMTLKGLSWSPPRPARNLSQ